MNPSLSREAYAILELQTTWQLRPHLRPASTQAWGAETQALIVAVVASESAARLWGNIGNAARSLGIEQQLWARAEIAPSLQAERFCERVLQDRPGQLLVFGGPLQQALLSMQPELETLCTLRCVDLLENISQSAVLKRELMSCLLSLKKELQ